MTGLVYRGILRVAYRIAYSIETLMRRQSVVFAIAVVTMIVSAVDASPADVDLKLKSFGWDFSRKDDLNFDKEPDGWSRYQGIGFPSYVGFTIDARDPEFEKQVLAIDARMVGWWRDLRRSFPHLSALPPSISDATVNRCLKIQLDGGQFMAQSSPLPASRIYQYGFATDIMTEGLRHDTARAELVFLGDRGQELSVHPTVSHGGTTPWTRSSIDLVRPPVGATHMIVRVVVQHGVDGLEDIRGAIGFDNLTIRQFPQLQIWTDDELGIYQQGSSISTTAKIMGLPSGKSNVLFTLLDHDGNPLATERRSLRHREQDSSDQSSGSAASDSDSDSEVTWTLPLLDAGFYRVNAAIDSEDASPLSTEVTFAVIATLVDGPPHGPFGWTLPRGAKSINRRELAPWLSKLGVAWVKYPCWLETGDTIAAEQTAALLAKMQDAGLQTVGMLDLPPDSQVAQLQLQGRRDWVAAQVFRDVGIWQPMLEPVMARMTLKVRMWQLGGERDYSFLGRPRLRDSIIRISTGLQGFGQPIDVALSWPWLEEELGGGETSWQAICRSSEPPLTADELDAFLTLGEDRTLGESRALGESRSRSGNPQTWLLIDPIDKVRYGRDERIRDLVLRMATTRAHRVQATFVSDPHDETHGLLRPDSRPDELLLPWRTTSRLIGNLRRSGSLQLQCGAQNTVFFGDQRAVLMLWSAEATEEKIYLGENVKMIDVWGRSTELPVQVDSSKSDDLLVQTAQPYQRVPIGPVPVFIVGVDPTLLAFRMSVELQPRQLDSLLGQTQPLTVRFANSTRDSLVGTVRIVAPESWSIQSPMRGWESLAGRSVSEPFDVVLGNTAKIGTYDVPLQFSLETVPPKLITVHRQVDVGPDGLVLKITTRLLQGRDLKVQIEMTNRSARTQAYDCLLFPPPGRQYQRRFVTIRPGETVRQEIFWQDGTDLIGKTMLLRAVEQDGIRVLNYTIDVRR